MHRHLVRIRNKYKLDNTFSIVDPVELHGLARANIRTANAGRTPNEKRWAALADNPDDFG